MKRFSIMFAVLTALVVAAPVASAQDQPAQVHASIYQVQLIHQKQGSVHSPVTIKIVTDRPDVRFDLRMQGVPGKAGFVSSLKPVRVRQGTNGAWAIYLTIRRFPKLNTNYNITSPDVLYHEDYPQGVVYAFHVAKKCKRK